MSRKQKRERRPKIVRRMLPPAYERAAQLAIARAERSEKARDQPSKADFATAAYELTGVVGFDLRVLAAAGIIGAREMLREIDASLVPDGAPDEEIAHAAMQSWFADGSSLSFSFDELAQEDNRIRLLYSLPSNVRERVERVRPQAGWSVAVQSDGEVVIDETE